MTPKDKVDNLFKNTLMESDIKHFSVCGFDKYIVSDMIGTLFVIWFDKANERYALMRTTLMKKKYAKAKISFDIKPDYELLYCHTVRGYRMQEKFDRNFKSIFDVLDSFYDIIKGKIR